MINCDNCAHAWTPCEDIFENYTEINYAFVILNRPINIDVDHRKILNLWNNAKLRVTVDGGTKRWLHWLQAHQCNELNIIPPDLITGDMDSIPSDVLAYFQAKNSQIIKTPDQDEMDFTKALKEIKSHCDNTKIEIDTYFVLGDTSGRFDQIIANINTLFKAAKFLEGKKIYQIAANSVTWLLIPGKHRISVPERLRKKQEWCGLIPIGAPCRASSTGLKWNLDNTELAFGEIVSTSNTYSGEPFVEVINDGFLVFSMGIEAIL